MREIKFRIWDKENSCFYKPTYEAYKGKLEELLISPSGDLCMRTLDKMVHQSLFPDRFEIMQYTGLQDKNGVEIYEGDLVKWGKEARPAKVVFGNHCIGKDDWDVEHKTPCFCIEFLDGSGHSGLHEEYELVGNIYQNPELLTA